MPKIILKIISTKLFKRIVMIGLKELARRTDNKVDDSIVKEIEKVIG